MKIKSNLFKRVKFCYSLLLILLFLGVNWSSASSNLSEVQPDDSWDFEIQKAYMVFTYSPGPFNFRSSTQGYRLGNTIVPVQEEIAVTVISIETSPQPTIIYQITWKNTSVVVNTSSLLVENGLQESLGRGVLGSGFDFLFSDSGVTVGDWVFIVPIDKLSSSPIHVWNQSTLPGAIEGMETILDLGDEENEKDYHMWIKYEGKMDNDSLEINFQFTFETSFRWEKNTGVLLAYEIFASMEGEYQSYAANFNLELKLERTDNAEFFGNNVSGFDLLILMTGFMMIIFIRKFLRYSKFKTFKQG
ncbi:MAG: hypothetical protein JSW11_02560 [Candidatus Heimdallarchaeota archaeon]|nr:MAG: hypothetical protein JSW11_02560 [Candidatus Heimdallarchaeota archaeon]